ncbi:MAG: hypothetical protein JWO93_2365, partial [Micrococcaceae bacterium]|nr:hypothetical protein [Micrococcaceae bacterium]
MAQITLTAGMTLEMRSAMFFQRVQ